MALLYFQVQADYEQAIRLREECSKLEKQLSESTYGSREFQRLSNELTTAKNKMKDLVNAAAGVGVEMTKAFYQRDNEFAAKIERTSAALRRERDEVIRLSKEVEEYQNKVANLKAEKASQADISAMQQLLDDAIKERDKHKGFEFSYQFDLDEIKFERADAAKQSELYKYIMEGASEGAEDAADVIQNNLGKAFEELGSSGNDVKRIFMDIVETASGVSIGNLISGGVKSAYDQLKDVYNSSVKVRAEMQDIESTMNIFLGSAEKSQQFVNELEDAAYFNMFEFSDLVEASKQMLAYQHEVESIIPRINQLSEVATATHKPLLGLVDMVNRAKSFGYIDSRMAQSIAAQGLVIKDVLKEMGESVNGTKISYEQFEKVLDYVTQEGGRFHGIMASQLNNIEAERGALEDNLHTMYNEMGEMFEGVAIKSLKFQTSMVEHWKEIAKVLGTTVALIGTYRTSLILLRAASSSTAAANVAQKVSSLALASAFDNETRAKIINAAASTEQEKAAMICSAAKSIEGKATLINSLAVDENTKTRIINSMAISKEAKEELLSAVAKSTNTGANIGLAGSYRVLTAAMMENTKAALMNPWVLLASALTVAVAGIIYLCNVEEEETRVSRAVAEEQENYVNALKERRDEEKKLYDVISDTTLSEWERYEAYKRMGDLLPKLTKDFTMMQLAEMTPKQREEIFQKYQREQNQEEDKKRLDIAKRANEYKDYIVGGTMSLETKEENEEYNALKGKSVKTEEEKARMRELAMAGRERALEMRNFYQSLYPDVDTTNVSIAAMQKGLEDFANNQQGYIKNAEEEAEKQKLLNMTYEERVELYKRQQEEADKAAKKYKELVALSNEQMRQNSTTDQLVELANAQNIDISDWLSLDEDELRAKIIDALRKVDVNNGYEMPEAEDKGANGGFLQTALNYANKFGNYLGSMLFGQMANEELKSSLEAAKANMDQKQLDADKTRVDIESQKTSRQLQKEHKTRELRIKNIQRRFASGNFTMDEAELEVMKFGDTLTKLIQTITRQGGRVTEAQATELNEKLAQELQSEQKGYNDAGGKDYEEAAERAFKLSRTRLENKKKLDKEVLEAENESIQSQINILADGSKRIVAQRNLDHKKEMEKIEQQHEDKIKAAEDAAKAEYLAANPDLKERDFEAAKASILSKSEIYKKLTEAADMSYEAQVRSAQVKFDSLQGIADKFDTTYIKNRKQMDELVAQKALINMELNNLEDRVGKTGREMTGKEITRLNALENKESLSDREQDEWLRLMQVKANSKLRDDEQKRLNDLRQQSLNLEAQISSLGTQTTNEFLKSFGTIDDKVGVIMSSMYADIAKAGEDEMARLTAVANAQQNIMQTIEKDRSIAPEQKIAKLNEYTDGLKLLEDEYVKYHKQALDTSLSDEERANADRLALAAKSAKDRMSQERIEQIGKITVQRIQESPEYFAAMQNPKLLTNNAINGLVTELESNRSTLSKLDPKDIQVITGLIDKLMDVEAMRDPFASMESSVRNLTEAQITLSAATAEYNRNKLEEEEIIKELKIAQEELNLAKMNEFLSPEQLQKYQERVRTLRERQTGAHNNTESSKNAYENATNAYISAAERVEKINEAALNKVKEMSSTFRSIGSTIASASGSKGGEIFGKAADVIAEITDAIVRINEVAQEFNDKNKLNIETQNANTELQAAQINMQASENMLNAANTNATSGDIPSDIDVGGVASKGASALNKASSIMAGIQMGLSIGTKFYDLLDSMGTSGEAKYEKYAKKLGEVNELTNSVNRYRRAALLAQQAEKNWFSTSGMSSLRDSWEVAAKSRDAYYAKLNEKQAAYRDQTKHDGDYLGNILVGSIAGAVTGATASSIAGPLGTLGGAIVGGLAGGILGATTSFAEQALGNGEYAKGIAKAQDNLRIETQKKHRSFMWMGGQNQKTADLRTWAKEQYGEDLFDSEGWVNKELAQEILDTYSDKLQGETEATLKELIGLKEQYDEYQQNLKEYVSSLYSPLVDNFVDAMWQWFDSGRDALYSFREAAAGTFRDIMSDMMKTIVLERVVGTFQDDIKDLYDDFAQKKIDESTLMKGVTNMTSDLMGRYEEQMPVLQSMMTNMSDAIESMGINMHQNISASSGSSKVMANVTQESIDETNGRLTGVQMTLQDIDSNIMYYGELFAKRNEASEPMMSAARDGWDDEPIEATDYSAVISFYGDSIISLNAANTAQRLSMHGESLNAIGGIAQQIAESYIELQGIHDDTTAMNKTMAQMRSLMNDWDNYIKRI